MIQDLIWFMLRSTVRPFLKHKCGHPLQMINYRSIMIGQVVYIYALAWLRYIGNAQGLASEPRAWGNSGAISSTFDHIFTHGLIGGKSIALER